MFAVIFEVQPRKLRWNDYLDIAKNLKARLEAIDGFIDNERFESKRTQGRLLSLSTWRDEKAVVRWRTQREHHGAQQKGRFEICEDYRLRVGEVTDDSDPPRGLALLQQRFDETANAAAKAVSITELGPREGNPRPAAELEVELGLDHHAEGLVDREVFESIYSPGKLLLLATWRDAEAIRRWSPAPRPDPGTLRHRRVRIIRDYGMTDRDEAPQFYPEPAKHGAAAMELRLLYDQALQSYRARILDNIDLDRLPDLRSRAAVVAHVLIDRGDARAFAIGREMLDRVEEMARTSDQHPAAKM